MVDWLGRGGIAHCTQAWMEELSSAGEQVELVTRSGRELARSIPGSHTAGRRGGALPEFLAVVAAARRLIRELRPRVVVLQGTVLPHIELSVVRTAKRYGATVILVAHEARAPHDVLGAQLAFDRLVATADVVIAHSAFVADQLAMSGRGELELLPLPMPLGLVRAKSGAASVIPPSHEPLALSFGNLHRSYKGLTTLTELAAEGVDGWSFAFVGRGAPGSAQGATTVSRFLEAGELVATVSASAATLLPYTRAAQSAAVVLAQATGSVVVVTSVGGINEQVQDGVTGRLLPAGAGVQLWREALLDLSSAQARERLTRAARDSVEEAHARFRAGALRVTLSRRGPDQRP